MKIAEELYQKGYISYPRTETNAFEGIDLRPLIQIQTQSQKWGDYAQYLLDGGYGEPKKGTSNDQAHPPIHPTAFRADLQGKHKELYEFIVRHFLAVCSKDALGTETTIQIEIAEELFNANGLIILEENWLKIYPYIKWADKPLPQFRLGEVFTPTTLIMHQGSTTSPSYLTEHELIALMDKNGIGTDATIAQHIETVQTRNYVNKEEQYLLPTVLGLGLYEGYESIGMDFCKPQLRAETERFVQEISLGLKDKASVVKEQLSKYSVHFDQVAKNFSKIETVVGQYLTNTERPPPPDEPFPDPQQGTGSNPYLRNTGAQRANQFTSGGVAVGSGSRTFVSSTNPPHSSSSSSSFSSKLPSAAKRKSLKNNFGKPNHKPKSHNFKPSSSPSPSPSFTAASKSKKNKKSQIAGKFSNHNGNSSNDFEAKKKIKTSSSSTSSAPRKCSLCRQTGHTKKNCPNN